MVRHIAGDSAGAETSPACLHRATRAVTADDIAPIPDLLNTKLSHTRVLTWTVQLRRASQERGDTNQAG